jgi:NAD(P)-dependent dehydrogenase (short-subunit alcohol dehydrogenase family)
MFDLKGRIAIVTGGNGGIGLGVASCSVSSPAQAPRRSRS